MEEDFIEKAKDEPEFWNHLQLLTQIIDYPEAVASLPTTPIAPVVPSRDSDDPAAHLEGFVPPLDTDELPAQLSEATHGQEDLEEDDLAFTINPYLNLTIPNAGINSGINTVSRNIPPEGPIEASDLHLFGTRNDTAGYRPLAIEGAIDQGAALEHERAVLERVQEAHGILVDLLGVNGAGWTKNILHSIGREATITTLTTFIRETLGYFAAQNLDGASETAKVAISGGILGLTGVLNVVAHARQEMQHKANWTTRAAHASTIILLGGAAAAAHKTTGLGAIAPLLIKATGYCLSRDGINLFIRLNNNRDDPQSLKSIATEMVVYALNQWIVNELQGLSISGTSDEAQAHAYREIFGRLLAFSAANAVGETFQAFDYPALVTFYNNIGSGIREALRATGDLRLTTSINIPMGDKLVARFPAAEGWVGTVTASDAVDKVLGPMTGRQSAFVILFSLLSLLSKAGAAARFTPSGTALLINALAGISLGLLAGPFLGALATSSPPLVQPAVV